MLVARRRAESTLSWADGKGRGGWGRGVSRGSKSSSGKCSFYSMAWPTELMWSAIGLSPINAVLLKGKRREESISRGVIEGWLMERANAGVFAARQWNNMWLKKLLSFLTAWKVAGKRWGGWLLGLGRARPAPCRMGWNSTTCPLGVLGQKGIENAQL